MKILKMVCVAMLLGAVSVNMLVASMIDDMLDSAYKGDLEAVKSLMAKGVNVNVANKNDETPFVKAIEGGHLELADYLIENGVDIKRYGGYALSKAVEKGNLQSVQYLINKGVDIRYGEYLITATQKGNLEMVKFLVENGANNDEKPLILASQKGNIEIVKCLMQSLVNKKYFSSALIEATTNGHFDIVKLLAENGADVDYEAQYLEKTAFIISLEKGYLDIAQYIAEKMKEYKINDIGHNSPYSKKSPLMWAAEKGNLAIVKILVERGANIHSYVSADGYMDNRTALMYAAGTGNLEIVQYLLSKGA